jgi:DNA-binding PadR family transcriptional regulator
MYIITTYVKITYMTTRDGINTALKIIGLTGLAGVAIVAPNATQGLKLILKRSKKKDINHKRVLAELKRQGLVHITKDEDRLHYAVTPAGAYRLQQLMLDEINIEIPQKWDKKWRIVCFDVPNNFSKQRAAFTDKLQRYDFVMLQKSTWVHPAPCFEQIEQLASHYNVLRYCTLLEVSRMDDLATQKLLRRYNTLRP